jgi:hypothetical protein
MPSEITSIYQLLDLARERPGMYGIGGKSLVRLNAFIAGLSYGNLEVGDPPFWDFWTWGMVHTGRSAHNSRPLNFLEELPDEEGYLEWFKLLDEYRKCHKVELARLPGSMAKFPESMRSDGRGQPFVPYTPPTPLAIRIGRYGPSDVFFVEQIFADRAEKLTGAIQPTLLKSTKEAERAWQVRPEAWGLPLD